MNFHVGQKLWYVPDDWRGKPYEVSVTKVGRVWVETTHRLRFDKTSMAADGGKYSSPGRAHLSKEVHDAELALHKAWLYLRQKINGEYRPPGGVTADAIEQVRRILFSEQL